MSETIQVEIRLCITCGVKKALTEFAPYSLNVCRACRTIGDRRRWNRTKNKAETIRWKNYRNRDKAMGQTTMDRKEAIAQMLLPCFWCEEEEEPRGLDRVDNRLGHVASNVVPCCARCNHIRSDMPFAVMQILKSALIQIRKEGLLKDWKAPFVRASRSRWH